VALKTYTERANVYVAGPDKGRYWRMNPATADKENATLVHIAGEDSPMDIGEFRDSLNNLSEAFKERVRLTAADLLSRGLKGVWAPTYNYAQIRDNSFSSMLKHVQEIGNLLSEPGVVESVSAIETRMYGPWGEQYDAHLAGYSGLTTNAAPTPAITYPYHAPHVTNATSFFNTWVAETDRYLRLGIRFPGVKALLYANGSFGRPLTLAEMDQNTAKARLSHWDDAIQETPHHGGGYLRTYFKADGTIGASPNPVSYIGTETLYGLFHGGETEWTSDSQEQGGAEWDSPSFQAPTLSRARFEAQHTSYLNYFYNPSTWNLWRNSSGNGGTNYAEEVNRRLGYRFHLVSSDVPATAPPSVSIPITLNVLNNGFASPFNRYHVDLILRRQTDGAVVRTRISQPRTESDPRLWWPGQTTAIGTQAVLPALSEDVYDVFLHVCSPFTLIRDRSDYSIPFATQLVGENLMQATGWLDLRQELTISNGASAPSLTGTIPGDGVIDDTTIGGTRTQISTSPTIQAGSVQATVNSSGVATVTWDEVGQVEQVFAALMDVSVEPPVNVISTATIPVGQQAYQVTVPGGSFDDNLKFRVQVVKNTTPTYQKTDWSNVIVAKTATPTIPDKPTTPNVVSGVTSGTVTISFPVNTTGATPTSYTVRRYNGLTVETTLSTTTSSGIVTASDTVSTGVDYTYRAVAIISTNNIESDPASFRYVLPVIEPADEPPPTPDWDLVVEFEDIDFGDIPPPANPSAKHILQWNPALEKAEWVLPSVDVDPPTTESQITYGSGVPDESTGNDGGLHFDLLNREAYGPKTASGWGVPWGGFTDNVSPDVYAFKISEEPVDVPIGSLALILDETTGKPVAWGRKAVVTTPGPGEEAKTPTNFALTVNTSTQVSLAWQGFGTATDPGTAGYIVERRDSPAGTPVVLTTAPTHIARTPSSLNYSFTDLPAPAANGFTPGNTYDYRVIPFDTQARQGVATSWLTVITKQPAPVSTAIVEKAITVAATRIDIDITPLSLATGDRMVAIIMQDNGTTMPASLDGGRWVRIGTDVSLGNASARHGVYYRNVPGPVGATGGEVANQILNLGVSGRHVVQIRKFAQGTFEPTSVGIYDARTEELTVVAGTPSTVDLVFGTPTPNNNNSKVLVTGALASGSTGALLADRITAPGTATDLDDVQAGSADSDRLLFSAFVPATAANTPLPQHTFTVKNATVGIQGGSRIILIMQPVGGVDPPPVGVTSKPEIVSTTTGTSDPTTGLVATADTPVGTGVGDRLVATLFVENASSPASSITSTSGLVFNKVRTTDFAVGSGAGTYRIAFYTHNVTAPPPTPMTFPTGVAGRHMVQLHRLQAGTFENTQFGYVAATSVDSTGSVTFPTPTSNNTNSRALLALAFGSGSGAAAGSRVTFAGGSPTKILDTQTGTTATDNLLQTAYVNMPTSGSNLAAVTGTVASPAAGTHPAAAALLVMQPVGGTDIPPPSGPVTGTLYWTVSNDRNMGQDWSSITGDPTLNSGQVTVIGTTVASRSPRFTYVTNPAPITGSRTLQITAFSADRDYYTTSAQRSELGHDRTFGEAPTVRTFTQGMDVWWAYSIYVPSTYPTVSNWCTFQQNKVIASGNGPFSLYFESGRFKWNQSASQSYGSTNISTVWTDNRTGGTARNVWHKWLLHAKWSTGSDGFIEVFGDVNDGQGFRTIVPRINRWTLKLYSDGGPATVEVRSGVYRQALSRDDSMYFGRYAAAKVEGAQSSAQARAVVTNYAFGVQL
jgi:hypothetical protein